jgi:hypothetical protein
MWKVVTAAAIVFAIAGSSLVYAQQRPAAPGADNQAAAARDAGARWRPTAEDAAALAEARIAALKAGLKLTPEQEKNWPPVEAAIRELAKERFARMEQRHTEREQRQAPPDPVQRMRERADAMTAAAAGLKRLADAADPLYKSLDENQKRRFVMLAHSTRHGHGHGSLRRWSGHARAL